MHKQYSILITLFTGSMLCGALRDTQRPEKMKLLEPVQLQEYVIKKNDTRFVVVVPSYNNASWYRRNLLSIFVQKYENYRVIYIDDCSSDNTGELVQEYIKEIGQEQRVTLICNKHRMKAMANIYTAIQMCDDREVVVMLDGDDWFINEHVLELLSDIYTNPDVWLTYGSFAMFTGEDYKKGWASAIPAQVIQKNAFRFAQPAPSHLRTFYAKLFKKIDKKDLCENGSFYEYTYDLAMMFPMIEMAGERTAFISQYLYVYNNVNTISDHRLGRIEQRKTDLRIRAKARYKRIAGLFDDRGDV